MQWNCCQCGCPNNLWIRVCFACGHEQCQDCYSDWTCKRQQEQRRPRRRSLERREGNLDMCRSENCCTGEEEIKRKRGRCVMEGGYWSGHGIALPDRTSVKDSLELRYVQGIADGDWVPWRMSDEESSPWLGSMKRIWIRGFIIGRRLAVKQAGATELGVCGGCLDDDHEKKRLKEVFEA